MNNSDALQAVKAERIKISIVDGESASALRLEFLLSGWADVDRLSIDHEDPRSIPVNSDVSFVSINNDLPHKRGFIQNLAAKMPVVLLIPEQDESLVLDALKLGVQDYLVADAGLNKLLVQKTLRFAIERYKTHSKLKRSERDLKQIQTIARIAGWEWYPDDDRFEPSDQFLDLLALPHELKTDQGIFFLFKIHSEDRQGFMEAMQADPSDAHSIYCEVRLEINGDYRPFLFKGDPMEQAGGRAFHGSAQDITLMRSTATSLGQRERFLELTGEIALIGGWELDLVENKIYWSDMTFALFEVSRSIEPTLDLMLSNCVDGDRARVENILLESIEKQTPFDFEKEIITPKSGKKWIKCKGEAVVENGKTVKLSGILQDITESRARLEALRIRALMLDGVTDAAIAITGEGKIIYWNQAAENLYKYSKQEAIGKQLPDFNITLASKEKLNTLLGTLKSGKPYSGEYLMQDRDGRQFEVSASNYPVMDENGKLVALLGISKDITEQKAQARTIAENEERFRMIFEYSPVGKGLTDVFTGRWLDANNALLNLLGYTKEEFLKRKVRDITPAEYQIADSKEFENIKAGDLFGPYQKDYFSKSGERLKVIIAGFTVLNTDGHIHAWSHIIDITELENKTQALKKSEDRFKNYVENSSDVILTINPDGIFTYLSPNVKKLYGFEPSEVEGKYISDFAHPDDVELIISAFVRSLEDPDYPLRLTYRTLHKNGSYKWVQSDGRIREDENGNAYGLVVVRDINKEHKAELTVLEHNRKLRDIAFIQSHVVRRPLANIMGILDMEEMEGSLTEAQKPLFKMLRGEALALNEIVTEIVDKSAEISEPPKDE